MLLCCLIGMFLTITCLQAWLKPVWGDELITLYVARQPGVSGVWRALQAGADPNPPLMHLMVKASTSLLGSSPLAMRLPAIACGLLALLAMWTILRRWVTPWFAAAGVLAWMTTRGFDYSYDARSYAALMAFAMTSLACWLATREATRRTRAAALAGMAVALIAGYSSNYYGVLAFVPLAIGETVDGWTRKRLRPEAWLTLLAAGLPGLAYLPLIRQSMHEFVPHAWNRVRFSMVGFSYVELVEGIVWPVLGLFLFAMWKRRRAAPSISMPERAALVTFLLYPVLGYLLARGGAGIISPRCVIPVCCAFGLAAGLLAERVWLHSRRALYTALTLLLLWVTVRETACAFVLLGQRRAFAALSNDVLQQAGSGPLLVGDSSFVLPFYFYADPATRARVVFPVDFGLIHQFETDDSGEQNLWAGRSGVFPFPVVPLSTALGRGRFAVIGRPDGWLVHGLQARGAEIGPPLPSPAWDEVGGVFTPMAHPRSRVQTGTFPSTPERPKRMIVP